MIDSQAVASAVLARLTAAGTSMPGGPVPVGDLVVPPGDPATYVVLEYPPGTRRDGSYGEPESDLRWRCRVRTVARHASTSASRPQASNVADRLLADLLDRTVDLAGDGWVITGRYDLGRIGPDDLGPMVEVVDDVELLVVPGPASPGP